jgi:hypothetical protein
MFDEDIPETLRGQLLEKQGELQQIAKLYGEAEAALKEFTAAHAKAKADGQDSRPWWRAIKEKRAQVTTILADIDSIQKDLKAILRECHKYEATIPFRSNVAGDITKLRMPVTRSTCYPHAARLPARDDQ